MNTTTIARGAVLALAVLTVSATGWIRPEPSEARDVRNTTRTNVNRNVNANRNVNVNQNVNVNRNVNVSRNIDVDVDRHYNDYHPVARAAAVTAATVATAAVVGSMVRTLPPACAPVVINGFTYQNCGGTWYQPQYAGTSVTYVVVNQPG